MRLKELREEKGLSQFTVATDLGFAQTSISAWERGINEPNLDCLKIICKYFNVSSDYLLGLSDDYGTAPRTTAPTAPMTMSAVRRQFVDRAAKLPDALLGIAEGYMIRLEEEYNEKRRSQRNPDQRQA
jgi:transcriptional regulator with XRE-family HTH domain